MLAKLAFTLLSVPAPIEHVFSHGGLMMIPKKGSTSPELVEELVFLKCKKK